jgi:predicted Zn-dependent peptidase
VNTWLEPYQNATVDDIARTAAKYLVPENRATSLFVPQS